MTQDGATDEAALRGGVGEEISLEALTSGQQSEAEAFATRFLREVFRLRGVRIDRAQFLRAELHKRGIAPDELDRAISQTPIEAGLSPRLIDDIALASIKFETRKSSAMSFAAGMPGGLAMLATVPTDITQFYVHALRIAQKLTYVYGWQSLLQETQDIDDETLGKLSALLGVMMGVGMASGAVTSFATQVARPAVEKQVAKVALTKTAWYGPMKQVLRIVGVKVTRQTFAATVSKAVPVVGGVVSGSMTLVMLDTQSKRLMRHLRELPPPNVDAAQYLAMLRDAEDLEPNHNRSMGESAVAATTGLVNSFRPIDLDGDGVNTKQACRAGITPSLSALFPCHWLLSTGRIGDISGSSQSRV